MRDALRSRQAEQLVARVRIPKGRRRIIAGADE
jgi:hypothetical protein